MTRRGAGDVVGRLTPGAREIHRGAFENAIRLGHRYVGSEHFLLALAGANHPPSDASCCYRE